MAPKKKSGQPESGPIDPLDGSDLPADDLGEWPETDDEPADGSQLPEDTDDEPVDPALDGFTADEIADACSFLKAVKDVEVPADLKSSGIDPMAFFVATSICDGDAEKAAEKFRRMLEFMTQTEMKKIEVEKSNRALAPAGEKPDSRCRFTVRCNRDQKLYSGGSTRKYKAGMTYEPGRFTWRQLEALRAQGLDFEILGL